MAGQRGFLYEGRLFNKLKSKNLIPVGITPAGADASRPDAVFFYKNVPWGIMAFRDKENYKKLFKAAEKSPMQRQRVLDKLKSEAQKTGGNVMSADEMQKLKGESEKSFKDRMQKSFSAKKGGLAKKKKKFPDISGDGKVTMKDVLMARGVIPKNKKDKKKVI